LTAQSGRPPRYPDPDSSLEAAFAAELRKLCRETAAREGLANTMLDARELERRTHAIGQPRSKSTLSEALSGRRLPSWTTTRILVTVLGDEPANWRERFLKAGGRVDDDPNAGNSEVVQHIATNKPLPRSESGPTPTERASEQWPRYHQLPSPNSAIDPGSTLKGVVRTRRMRLVLSILVLTAVGCAWWFLTRSAGTTPRLPTITVQNMVAIGPTSLTEDVSPAYLSTRAIARCASMGCMIPNTEMSSGIALAAVCQTKGQYMTNADEASEGINENPGVARSDRWYGVQQRDGSVGLISEIYVRAEDRGGLGLPDCREFATRIPTVAPVPKATPSPAASSTAR
jgi:hypothetical protein